MDSVNGRKVPIAKRREAEEESDERVRLMNECMDRSGETQTRDNTEILAITEIIIEALISKKAARCETEKAVNKIDICQNQTHR